MAFSSVSIITKPKLSLGEGCGGGTQEKFVRRVQPRP